MKHKLYFFVIVCVSLGVFFQFVGPHISEWMASSAPHQAQQQKLSFFYQTSIFGPLGLPAQAVPTISARFVPSNYFTLFRTLVEVLFYAQIALVLRRITISVRARKIQPPPSLNSVWKTILWVSLTSWLVGVIAILLPRLATPALVGVGLAKGIGFASAFVGAFIVPFFWLVPSNLFGPSFFVLELLSFRAEGLLPSPNPAVEGTLRDKAAHRPSL